MRHFYGVQYLNKSVKSFVMFHLLFQSAEETFVLQFLLTHLTCVDKTEDRKIGKLQKLAAWQLLGCPKKFLLFSKCPLTNGKKC